MEPMDTIGSNISETCSSPACPESTGHSYHCHRLYHSDATDQVARGHLMRGCVIARPEGSKCLQHSAGRRQLLALPARLSGGYPYPCPHPLVSKSVAPPWHPQHGLPEQERGLGTDCISSRSRCLLGDERCQRPRELRVNVRQ